MFSWPPSHLSFSDPILTPLIVERRVTFVANAEYFTGGAAKGWLTRQFFVGTGTVPVDRSGAQAARVALDTPLPVLASGGITHELKELPGREYVDVYAQSIKFTNLVGNPAAGGRAWLRNHQRSAMPARRRSAETSVTTIRRPSVRSQPRLANDPIAWLTLCREPPAISAN